MKYDFEASFKEFVKQFPGELVSEGESKSADFFFPADNIVAELKTLQEDARREYAAKLTVLLNRWTREKLMPRIYGTAPISLQSLSPECQLEWAGILQAPIENIIRKANRQIRSTKQSRNCPDARGLSLIANDGNFLARVLAKKDKDGQRRFPHIHGVIYFSYRIRSRDEGLPFWVAGYTQSGGDSAMTAFQHRLQTGWFSYLSRIISNKGLDIA